MDTGRVTADALDAEYENGVADVLGYLAGDAAVVERNARMPGRLSGKRRQIDVKVTGTVFGSGNVTMIVDCKRYKKPIDVTHVAAFVGLVEDVGADVGLLVTTTGISDAARTYAENQRGIWLNVFSVDELTAWSSEGTVHWDYAIPEDRLQEAIRAARRAGFRVRPIAVDPERGDVGVGIKVFRHLGVPNPPGELQIEARDALLSAFAQAGIDDPVSLAGGITVDGGTPGHRWLFVTIGGVQTKVRILAASEEDIVNQLDRVVHPLVPGIPREQLNVVRPDPWPIPTMFPRW